MNFGNPSILLQLIWIIPFLILFIIWSWHERAMRIERFVEKALVAFSAPRFKETLTLFRNMLSALAVVLFVLALAEPRWGIRWRNVEKEGLDMVFAIDVSKSMLARDFEPNRMKFVIDGVKKFVKGFQGHRVGIVSFSGDAFLQCPLTVDYAGFLLILGALDQSSVPRGGTAIIEALEEASNSFEGAAGRNRLVFLISDGEDHEGGLEEALKKARRQGIIIHVIGVGTEKGEKIPIDTDEDGQEYLKDRSGRIVISKLNEGILRKIAETTGGSYILASQTNFGIETLYKKHISGLDGVVTENIRTKELEEKFQYPLSLAIFILMVELLMRNIGAKEK